MNVLVRMLMAMSAIILSFPLIGADKNIYNQRHVEKFGFVYGVGINMNNGIYKDYDLPIIPLPIIGYKGEDFTVYGPFISYHILKNNGLKISMNAAPRFGGFDEDDADIFNGMESRKISLDTGLSLNYKLDSWEFESSAMFDVLNRSNGHELKTNISKMMRFGPIFIKPSIGVSYLDSNHVDYYYGVHINEVSSGRSFYQGESSVNKTTGISIMTPIFFGGMTALTINNTWYDSVIVDSPLTDGDSSLGISLIFSKIF